MALTALDAAIAPEQTLSISPVLLRALDEAAAAGRVAETILLAHRIVGVQDLAAADPADMARVADALDAAGQSDAAGGAAPRDRRVATSGTMPGRHRAAIHCRRDQRGVTGRQRRMPVWWTTQRRWTRRTVAAPTIDAGQSQQTDDENSL